MKKISLILVLFFLIFKPSFANTYSSDPEIFIKELVNDAIDKLSDNNISKEEKAEFMNRIYIENVWCFSKEKLDYFRHSRRATLF